VRRAFVLGDSVIAITDHVDFTNLEFVLKSQRKLKGNVSWDIKVLVGVELTHIPVDKIARLAGKAKRLGAEVVVLHGESPCEPVEEGTNRVGVKCRDIDILAHPGDLSVEEAELARKNNVYLELTSRNGHCDGNVHVAEMAVEAKAKLLVNTDAHVPEDLITQEEAYKIAVAAGLSESDALHVVKNNPKEFMKKLK
jgi:histidinol phosphatase-like PHP family hydrolase